MEHGNDDDKGELTLEPAAVVRNRRPRALWGVLVALAVATGALVVTSLGDDGTERPGLPVALGGARTAEAAGAADSSMPAWVTYVAGDDLPALGGEAPAYRLGGTVSEDQVRALAEALGLDGEVAEQDGRWVVTGGTGTLEVYGADGGRWTYYRDHLSGGGSVGSPGIEEDCAELGDGVVSDCELTVTTILPKCATEVPCPPDDRPPCDGSTELCSAPEGCAGAPNDDTGCFPPGTTPAPEPVDVPSEDEARAIALEVVAASGFDTADASVTADGPADAWYLTVEPRLGGVPSGLSASVAVGPEGAIVTASGFFGPAEELGDYPVLDTRGAIDRANAQAGGVEDAVPVPVPVDGTGRGAVAPADDPCPDEPGSSTSCDSGSTPTTTVVAPQCKVQEDGSEICEQASTPGTICPQTDVTAGTDPAVGAPDTVECTPPPPPDTTVVPDPAPEPSGPIEIVLVDAEPALIVLPALDGSGYAYLVPAYRFTDENGGRVDLAAVADDALTTPTTTETTVPDTGVVNDPGGVEPVEPQPCGPPLVEEDASGTTHTVQPDPDCTGQPERIELMLHCVNIVDWQGMWWSTEAINAPDGWVGKGTITLEADGTATYVDDGAPDEPTTFIAEGPAEDYPPCA